MYSILPCEIYLFKGHHKIWPIAFKLTFAVYLELKYLLGGVKST